MGQPSNRRGKKETAAVVNHDRIQVAMIDGRGNSKTRDENLRRFNEDPACNVLLLASGPGSAGLTLTIANTLYMLEPTANAAEEAQAVSRVHRIGQTKTTRCVIFYAKHSCEERILALRQQQGQLEQLLASGGHDILDASIDDDEIKAEEENDTEGRKRKKKSNIAGGCSLWSISLYISLLSLYLHPLLTPPSDNTIDNIIIFTFCCCCYYCC